MYTLLTKYITFSNKYLFKMCQIDDFCIILINLLVQTHFTNNNRGKTRQKLLKNCLSNCHKEIIRYNTVVYKKVKANIICNLL